MNGFLTHLLITLKLNMRNKVALAMGYLVPIFTLLTFAALYRTKPTLVREFGQILAICALGGACFGMPVALVSERERGVWRRYRLMPLSPLWLIASTMVARYLIVLSSGILPFFIAVYGYGMPLPENPLILFLGFSFATFAFLGLGLIIAALANTTAAVQGMGQVIFLPMIGIGGIGVSLKMLPAWAQYVATFLPGRYAIEAMNAGMRVLKEDKDGLQTQRLIFNFAALAVLGLASTLIGAKMFRWEGTQRLPKSAKWYVLAGIILWGCVGAAAISWKMARIYGLK